uniref:TORC_M domain-containing protein n=1 Tax=Rhabditophanes sp. KR3021 TaxID=114890 RepID=A0AC35TU47_9BILA
MQMMANSGNSVTVNGFGGGLSNTSSRNTSPIPGPLPFPNIPYDGSIISSPVTSPQYPQHANFSTVSSAVCTPSTGSPISTTHDSPTNAYGNASFSNCATNEHQGHQFPQVMHQQVCNSASMPTQMSIHQQPQINQAQVQVQQQQQQQPVTSSNGYTIYNQNLISPYNGDSYSQSAPNSPANLRDNSNGQIKMWPPRNYSTSPDLIDIPNIVLTGVDGNLDCYQNLDPTLFHLNQSNVTDQTTPSLLN